MKSRVFPAARSMLASALILSQVFLPGLSYSQVVAPTIPVSTQFSVTGFIQAATLDPCGDELCGGTITVDNQTYVVPRSTILQMPAAALTWKQLFDMAPAGVAPGRTGLALQDVASPGARPNRTYEASLTGNRIRRLNADGSVASDQAIVGLMYLAQHSLQSGQGYINYIDYATGEFRVGGNLRVANSGARVKVNDPLGRFSRQWSADDRFTIDEDNPTIRSENGTPMCVPRTRVDLGVDDPWCPQANRPLAAGSPSGFAMVFQLAALNAVTPFTAPDAHGNVNCNVAAGAVTNPCRMVPFEIGDYVTYSGITVETDPTLIAAWNVTGNVGAFTAPGDKIAYVATEVALLGVGGLTVAGAAEATIRTRFEGFTSSVSTNAAEPTLINLYAKDVDCAGIESERFYGTIDVDPGPPNGAVPGRWRFRPPIVAGNPRNDPRVMQAPTFLPATREMVARVASLSGQVGAAPGSVPNLPKVTLATADCNATTAGVCEGITVNQYTSPIGEFLFPENAGTGQPIVPNNFEDMPFLANGSGPLDATNVFTTLSPWPGEFAPGTPGCLAFSGLNPNANAGADQTVTASAGTPVTVRLSGSGVDPRGLALTAFQWAQTAGPGVALTGGTTATPTFTAPNVAAPTTLTFSLVVTDSAGRVSAPDLVNVQVIPSAAADTIAPTLVEYRTSKQRLTVTVADSIVALPGPQLTMTPYSAPNATGTKGISSPMTNLGGGVFTIIQVGVAQPGSVVISSSAGGSVLVNVTAANPIVKIRQ